MQNFSSCSLGNNNLIINLIIEFDMKGEQPHPTCNGNSLIPYSFVLSLDIKFLYIKNFDINFFAIWCISDLLKWTPIGKQHQNIERLDEKDTEKKELSPLS